MFLKLNIKHETKKAFLLEGDGWIPKSALNSEGLNHPYYQLESWLISNLIDKYDEVKQIEERDKNLFISLKKCFLEFKDLPEDIKKNWTKYWKIKASEAGISNGNELGNHHSNWNDIGSINEGITFQDLY